MSDPRWTDVESDVANAVLHFGKAIDIHRTSRQDDKGGDPYVASMAFMHAMLAAHTSVEVAIVRILEMLGEEKPSGPDWHQMLIARLARSLDGEHARPALLDARLAKALKETKDFRHRALHTYDDFSFDRAQPAVEAASIVIRDFPRAVNAFRARVDPSDEKTRRANPPG